MAYLTFTVAWKQSHPLTRALQKLSAIHTVQSPEGQIRTWRGLRFASRQWVMICYSLHRPSKNGARIFSWRTPYAHELDKYNACPNLRVDCWPSFVGSLSCTCTAGSFYQNLTWHHQDLGLSLFVERRAGNLRASVRKNGLRHKGNSRVCHGLCRNLHPGWKEVLRLCGARTCPDKEDQIFQNVIILRCCKVFLINSLWDCTCHYVWWECNQQGQEIILSWRGTCASNFRSYSEFSRRLWNRKLKK